MSILEKISQLIIPVEDQQAPAEDNESADEPAPAGAGSVRVCYLILLDVSGSMRNTDFEPSRLKAAINAALALAWYLARNAPDCPVGVGTFASGFRKVVGPTPAGPGYDEIAASLQQSHDRGETEMADGLEGIRRMARQFSEDCRVTVLMLTDGHNTGRCPLPVATDLKEAGADLWAVGIGGDRSDVDEELLLKMVSSEKQYFFIGNWQGPEAIVRTFQEVAILTLTPDSDQS